MGALQVLRVRRALRALRALRVPQVPLDLQDPEDHLAREDPEDHLAREDRVEAEIQGEQETHLTHLIPPLTHSYRSSIGPSFGKGGGHYAGGATTPYRAGRSSPLRKIAPILLVGAALGLVSTAFLYGAYAYPYTHSYSFINRTNTRDNPNGTNETLPVTCVCERYSQCGCDEDDDLSYLDTIIGNGSVASLNKTIVNIAPVNGTKTIVLDGTLPNGTDTDSGDNSSSSAMRIHPRLLEASGFWALGAIVAVTVWAL